MKAYISQTVAFPEARVDSLPDIRESNPLVGRLFLWSLLGTIGMLFMAMVSAYLVRRSGSDWQPITLPRFLGWNALLLIPGTFVLSRAKSAAQENPGAIFIWIGMATLLGILFLAGQIYCWEIWLKQSIGVATNPYSSFFYLFSGMHALHVGAGIVWLLILFWRSHSPESRPSYHAICCAADYWLFLALLWLGLIGVLYFA